MNIDTATLDLSPMFERATAVICDTEEKAIELIENFILQHPKISEVWVNTANCWSEYRENTAYTLFYDFSSPSSNLMFGNKDEESFNGFTMIQFDELDRFDVPDIKESDESITYLFG